MIGHVVRKLMGRIVYSNVNARIMLLVILKMDLALAGLDSWATSARSNVI